MTSRLALQDKLLLVFGMLLSSMLLALVVSPAFACADLLPDPIGPPTSDPAISQPVDTEPADVSVGEAISYAGPLALGLFVLPLGLTLLIEVPIVVMAGRGSSAAWKTGFLVNTLTNPVAVLVVGVALRLLTLVPAMAVIAVVLVIEAVVTLVEGRVYQAILGWPMRKAFAVSLLANAASAGIGLVLTRTL